MAFGGYSSSTVLGINTRKYHGLLIAPTVPPAKRYLILSKIDESVDINGEKYNLYSNMCANYISEGYKYQEEFEKEYIPIFTYKVKDIIIKKMIVMQYGKNTVCVLYKIENKGEEAKLTLTPIINFRDFHSMSTNHEFELKQSTRATKVKIEIDGISSMPIYMNLSEGEYIEYSKNIFKDMYYIEEEKRGFFPEENHSVSGSYEVVLPAKNKKEISFICSLEENIEEIDIKKVINKEIKRINELMYDSEMIPKKQDITKLSEEKLKDRDYLRDWFIAIDNFVVYRPNFRLHTIIAGYPWFLDWGRDTLISFEGLLLVTKRFDIAKEVLLTIAKDIKFGLVPNGYSGYDNRPLYNSVDSSLLLFQAIYKYLEYTGDYDFIRDNFYDKLVAIVENYRKGIDLDDNNIYLDEDYLLVSGTMHTQNTWMDAKYENTAITPRNGKAVEINSLWYNSLKILEELSVYFDMKENAKQCKKLAVKCKETFDKVFYIPKRKSLYDVIRR